MSFEIEGKLVESFDEVVVTDKFKKREFVIETEDNANGSIYTEMIKFQLIQAKCDSLNYHKVGDQVKVMFNIKGRRYEKDGKVSYFNNLDAWRIEKAEGSYTPPVAKSEPFPEVENQGSDDLPF